jgi:arylsulfatase A-like enzyme
MHASTNRREFLKTMGLTSAGLFLPGCFRAAFQGGGTSAEPSRTASLPNIVLIMTDDQGWGQTGYYNHPVLKTPNLDAMAANGLRFDRFYAGSPVCSPTRASVLTGRHSDRCGVPSHGHALRLQEQTLPEALKVAGYTTGHFGKWHLNGLRGPGVPIFADDPHNPGAFGFDEWLSVTNFFDINPIMSRKGVFEEFEGDTSAIIVDEALKFISTSVGAGTPFFAVIWDGSPHSPFRASAEDRAPFADLNERSQHHYGELVAFDRGVGVLRKGLRDLGIADHTLVWFCSDNGGLPGVEPDTVGGLRDFKGSVWEGGLRVPAIIEWPARITPRTTDYPASVMDIFPTVAEIVNLPGDALLAPVDGVSLVPLFDGPTGPRATAIAFRYGGMGALVDNNYKLVATSITDQAFELYDLAADPQESRDIAGEQPEVFERMQAEFNRWNASVEDSVAGSDYPEGEVLPHPEPRAWMTDERYAPYLEQWRQRPEYAERIRRALEGDQ